MGVIICRKHGRSGIALVCEHVGKAVVERAPLPARSTVQGDIEGFVLESTYCAACIAERSLPTPPERLSGEAFERFCEIGFDPVPVCARCFAARERDQ